MLVVVALQGLEVAGFGAEVVQAVVCHIVEQVAAADADVVDNAQLVVRGEHYLVDGLVANEHEHYGECGRQHQTVSELLWFYGSMGSMWCIP